VHQEFVLFFQGFLYSVFAQMINAQTGHFQYLANTPAFSYTDERNFTGLILDLVQIPKSAAGLFKVIFNHRLD